MLRGIVLQENKNSIFRLQVSDWGSHGQSTRPPSDERSFGDPTPSTSTIEQPEFGLADPRIVYSNPYSR
jgi:hypothetical protein